MSQNTIITKVRAHGHPYIGKVNVVWTAPCGAL